MQSAGTFNACGSKYLRLPLPCCRWVGDSVAHLCLAGAVSLGSASAGTSSATASCLLGAFIPSHDT